MGQAHSDENSIPTTTTNTPPPSTNLPRDSHGDHTFVAIDGFSPHRDQTVCIHLWHCKAISKPTRMHSLNQLHRRKKKPKKKEEQPPVQDHRIIPPLWAKDPPRSNKSKL